MNKNTNSELIESIFRLSRLMKENMCYSSELTTLSLLQLQALIFLNKKKNAQMREIAEQFKIEMPTATSLINKLSTAKLILRQEDSKDRRLVRIVLTEQGKTLLDKAMKERTKKMHFLLSYLSDNDKIELLRIIQLLTKQMEKQDEN